MILTVMLCSVDNDINGDWIVKLMVSSFSMDINGGIM